MSLNGMDIAGYQANMNTKTIAGDFIIVKATQGTGYINPYFKSQIDGVIKSGRIAGIYHYANGSGVTGEVNFFLQTIKDYIGKAILCLDWETSENSAGRNTQFTNPTYAKQFMDEVKKRTGVTMFLYCSKSPINTMSWEPTQKAGYLLWGAQYANHLIHAGYNTNPWQSDKPWGPWGKDVKIHQYGYVALPGYNGPIDGDIAYMTAAEMKSYYGKKPSVISTIVNKPQVVVKPAETDPLDKANLLQIVADVQKGKYGSGDARKKKLGKRYDEVQKFINHIYGASATTLAKEAISGKYGNGELRKKVLGNRYNEVQKAINNQLKGMKDNTTIAKEVIAGKWGNDPERTKKLRAEGYDSAAIQKEVNRLLQK